jgi:hypothetical protein
MTLLSNLIRPHDDLSVKVPALLKKFSEEKSQVESKLKKAVETQLEDVQQALVLLEAVSVDIQSLQKHIFTIENVSEKSKNKLVDYDYIKQV